MKIYIDSIDISDAVKQSDGVFQQEGAITASDYILWKDSARFTIADTDGLYDPDSDTAIFGRGNDPYRKLVTVYDDYDQLFWAGWVDRWEKDDATKEVQIEAVCFSAKLRGVDMEYSATTDTPSNILYDILTDTSLGAIPLTYVDKASFDRESSYDTIFGISCYLYIPSTDKQNSLDIVQKIMVLFNKRIFVYRNVIYLDHEEVYEGASALPIDDLLFDGVKRYRDYSRAYNAARLAYKNGNDLAFVERDMSNGPFTVAEYAYNLNKYSVKTYPDGAPFVTTSDGLPLLCHATAASANFVADKMIVLRYEAPLVAEFNIDITDPGLQKILSSVPYYSQIDLTYQIGDRTYSGEPLEIEEKKWDYKNKKLFVRGRFVNLYPQRATIGRSRLYLDGSWLLDGIKLLSGYN